MVDARTNDLVLEGTEGPRRLRAAPGQRLVVIFYQEDSTPTCSTQVASFKEDFDLLQETGAEAVAISSDSLASHRAFLERLGGLPFPLLSDPEGLAAKAFGVWDPNSRRAHRSVLVVDDQGMILHAERAYSPANINAYEAVFRALTGEPS